MRRAKWALYGLTAIIVVTFICIMFHHYLHVPEMWRNLMVGIAWAAVIVAVTGAGRAEGQRRKTVRTCFLANNLLYNSEMGVVQAAGTAAQIDAMQDVLANLHYGFDMVEPPVNASHRSMADLFDYVVRTRTFKVAKTTRDFEPRLVSWQGEVASTAYPKSKPIPFDSREGLEEALATLRRK